jgi:Na+-driven multidrug efflux pump
MFGALYFIWPSTFLSIFSQEQELLTMAARALRIMVIMFPVIGAQVVFSTYFQAAGRGVPSLLLSILREVLLFIPFLLLFSHYFGLDGVWFSRPASDLLAFIFTFYLITRELKKHNLSLIRSIS